MLDTLLAMAPSAPEVHISTLVLQTVASLMVMFALIFRGEDPSRTRIRDIYRDIYIYIYIYLPKSLKLAIMTYYDNRRHQMTPK